MVAQALLLLTLAATVAAWSDKCLNCICNVESQCRPVGCKMDLGSLSCGHFQIKLPYYQDCGTPGKQPWESVEDAWKRCSDDYNCALGCMKRYYGRYKGFCQVHGKTGCEKLARIHNGGPQGCHQQRTDVYWQRVQNCLQN